MPIDIEYVDKLHPIFTKPKRIKIIVGGRGSTKSTGIADYVSVKISTGELWCCAREHQNSIEESVHRTMLSEIDRLGLPGFVNTKNEIAHPASGGRNFYKGLARNITGLKSTLSGIDGLWIEEGEDLSEETLRVLTASVRLDATDTQRMIQGEDVKFPEIIITMNRRFRTDPIASKYLARAEKELARCGYYEDDAIMVVELNYTDMPEEWFLYSGLEQERADDFENMPRALYDSKWHGKYLEYIDNAIILPEWFDAAVDAHKQDRLKDVFKPVGAKIAAHDPSDSDNDAKGYAIRHGSVFTHVLEKTSGEIDIGCDWAIAKALQHGADWFVWDGDGMGAGLKRQISQGLEGTRTNYYMFRGSLSGKGQDNADNLYQPESGKRENNPKTFAETFKNNRAQYYTRLADRFFATYRCVVRGEYVDPDEMVSIDSDGVENIEVLKAELCRIPIKPNNNGLIQIMNKTEMKAIDIDSPNMADSMMMALFVPVKKKPRKKLNYQRASIA